MNTAELITRRDAKVKPHLEQYAPVWIVDEKLVPEEEAQLFNVVFQHNRYGWVSRRYKFDGFNKVLYLLGQRNIGEDAALKVQAQEPYIAPVVADIPNAYGG